MEWLNYHHLFYFHTVVREGGVAAAARKLRISHPTVSAQLRLLEESLGEPLFVRGGRTLSLTETGRFVADYAGEIFSLGKELVDGVRLRPTARAPRLTIGISDPMPKLVARRLLAVYDHADPPVRLAVRQASTPELVGELLARRVDAVLTDAAGAPAPNVFDHLLGECGTTFFAAPRLAKQLLGSTKGPSAFPQMLDGAPFLMPGLESAMRRGLEEYFAANDLHPRIVAEVDDSALLKVFGQDGVGVFAGPTPLADEIRVQYRVQVLGTADSVRERYHLLSLERKIGTPLIARIVETSHQLFPSRKGRVARSAPTSRR